MRRRRSRARAPRPVKRLRFVREEHAHPADPARSVGIYRAKRKREVAILAPHPEGGWSVTYVKDKRKTTVIAPRLAEAREAVEAMRDEARARARNPLALPKFLSSNGFWWGLGIGVVAMGVAAVVVEKRAQAALAPPLPSGSGSGTTTPALPPASSSGSSASSSGAPAGPIQTVQLQDAAAQNVVWDGVSTLELQPPPGYTGFAAVNGTTLQAGTSILQLAANPVGTFNVVYNGSGQASSTVTVTGGGTASSSGSGVNA